MKHVKVLVTALAFVTGVSFTSCKSKPKESNTSVESTTPQTTAPAPAPVVISADDSLRSGIADATKDYPGVTATVNNGEITLTGQVERTKLPGLMQSLNSLRPKKINNNLKVK
jgi:outer membrane receptor for ferrienterochelin and colicin